MSLQRERILILALLLILAAASWVILVWQSRAARGMGMGLTMGMGAAIFPFTAGRILHNYLGRRSLRNLSSKLLAHQDRSAESARRMLGFTPIAHITTKRQLF